MRRVIPRFPPRAVSRLRQLLQSGNTDQDRKRAGRGTLFPW